MRFSLIDEVLEVKSGERIVAAKNLTRAEEYLADHFPGFPVMPGVLVLETLVQASAWLMRLTCDFQYSTVLLSEAKALRFKSFVAPGHRLVVESDVHKRDGELWTFKVSGKVDGDEVVSARLNLKQFNLGERDERLRENDRRITEHLKLSWQNCLREELVSSVNCRVCLQPNRLSQLMNWEIFWADRKKLLQNVSQSLLIACHSGKLPGNSAIRSLDRG